MTGVTPDHNMGVEKRRPEDTSIVNLASMVKRNLASATKRNLAKEKNKKLNLCNFLLLKPTMTGQYAYNAVNSAIVYFSLAYIFCFSTFHLINSISYHIGTYATIALIIFLLIVYIDQASLMRDI